MSDLATIEETEAEAPLTMSYREQAMAKAIAEGANPEALEALQIRMRLLYPFLDDEHTQEVVVNKPGEVWSWKNGNWIVTPVPELTFGELESIGRNLANYSNKPFDRMNTSLSAFMPVTGERIEMTHPPTCPEGHHYLNIRKHSVRSFEHADLVKHGYYSRTKHQFASSLTEDQRARLFEHLTDEEQELWTLIKAGNFAKFMERAVENHQNIVASGATGSGKTSYLRSLCEFIDRAERIITIEDTPEMPLPNHRNRNGLFYRKDVKEGEVAEGVTAKDVLHTVMRKTPNRVLMAELRGDEAMYYLSGVLSSGHPGGLTTTHANSPKDAFFRLSLLIKQSDAGKGLELSEILMLLRQTVNVVVQVTFSPAHGRYVPAIYYDPMYRLTLLD
jgi:type IV secretion system protein VirB11